MIYKPVSYEIYETLDKQKVFITECYDKNYITYYLYSINDYTDVIACGVNEEWLSFKKQTFIKDRQLTFIKRNEFK